MSKSDILNSLKGRTFEDFIKDEKVPKEDKDFVMAILAQFDSETVKGSDTHIKFTLAEMLVTYLLRLL